MLTAGNTNFTYDGNGNMLTKTTNAQTTTSVAAVTDTYAYRAFGATAASSGSV